MALSSLRLFQIALPITVVIAVFSVVGITTVQAKQTISADRGQHDGAECATDSRPAEKAPTKTDSAFSAAKPDGKDKLLILSITAPGASGEKARQNQISSAASEHRTVEFRTLYLNVPELSPNAEAFYLRPDGSRVDGVIIEEKGVAALKIDQRPMDGSQDGVFTVYVIDRKVEKDILQVQTAKMYLINHTCSWGHKFRRKYIHHERQRAKSSPDAPFEIVGENLMDEYVHNSARSGEVIPFTLLLWGRPIPSSTLKVKSGTGWSRSFTTDNNGTVKVQLIRDYYPETWSAFKRSQRMGLLVSAEREVEQTGEFQGQAYQKIHYSTTFPWRYQLRRDEYSSYTYGIGIAAFCTVGASLGVLFYRERRRRPYREVVFDEKG